MYSKLFLGLLERNQSVRCTSSLGVEKLAVVRGSPHQVGGYSFKELRWHLGSILVLLAVPQS